MMATTSTKQDMGDIRREEKKTWKLENRNTRSMHGKENQLNERKKVDIQSITVEIITKKNKRKR